jgi:hypothetical protein
MSTRSEDDADGSDAARGGRGATGHGLAPQRLGNGGPRAIRQDSWDRHYRTSYAEIQPLRNVPLASTRSGLPLSPATTKGWVMRASELERTVAELHGVVSALRSVPTNDPRWHIYWAETLRLCQAIDANAPAPITNHSPSTSSSPP